MRITKELLVKAFLAGKEAAQALKDTEDGGTCNFDSPYFFANKIREKKVMEAAEEAGVCVCKYERYNRVIYDIEVMSGQANRRSRMAVAARKAMQEAGLPCGIYYRAD